MIRSSCRCSVYLDGSGLHCITHQDSVVNVFGEDATLHSMYPGEVSHTASFANSVRRKT